MTANISEQGQNREGTMVTVLPTHILSVVQNNTKAPVLGEEVIVRGGRVVPTSEAAPTGRYAIDRIIMEGDNVPLLSKNGPYFDRISPSNMTAVTGDSATLQCRVHNLGKKTVGTIFDSCVIPVFNSVFISLTCM